jgi:hypothetical protein
MTDLFDDTPETRVVLDQRDKNDFILRREEVYGHWKISRDTGLLPESLRGRYTRREEALAAITNYLNTFSLPKKIKEVVTKSK